MNIVVIDYAASEGGAMTILKEFYEEAKKDKNNSYVFLLSNDYLKETDNIKIVIDKTKKKHKNRLLFDLFTGKKFIKQFKPDLIFSLENTIIFGSKYKQIVYIHQSIPFQSEKKFSFLKKEERKYAKIQYLLGYLIKKSTQKADIVIVQTEWMKNAVSKKANVPKHKISILPPRISLPNISKYRKNNTNVFFYPTSNYLYKHNDLIPEIDRTLRAHNFKNYSFELTVNGQSTDTIKYLGKLTRIETYKKMSTSTLFFPSYIESYPLPLLEAKSLNAPIIAADTKANKYVLANYPNAYFFKPFDKEECIKIVERLLTHSNSITSVKQKSKSMKPNLDFLTIINKTEKQ